MGVFSSTSSCISRDDEISNNVNPGVLGIMVANSLAPRKFSSNEFERQHSPYNLNVDYSAFGQKSDRAFILGECDTEQPMEHANKVWSSSLSLSSSYSSPYNSLELENQISFDGLNKRASDRYDIGLDILKAKIECGADPKSFTTHGDRNSLMFSVMANDFSFTKELVERGVDVNWKNHLGETALSLAKELKREEIAKYLVAQGATKVPMADQ